MKFDSYIAELLKDHDCVIIPEFGGFVGNYAPAKINPINHRFDPPFRKITFNKLLLHNDGLLAAYIAQKEDKKFEESLAKLKDYAVFLKNEIRNNQRVDFDKIGVLYQQADGSFRFEQVKNGDFFTDGFGLDSFFSRKIERKPKIKSTVEPKAEKQITEPEKKTVVVPLKPVEEVQPEKQRKKVAVWPAAAAILALAVVGYGVWLSIETPLFTNSANFHYSDLNPFSEKICPEYEVRDRAIPFGELPEIEAIDPKSEAAYVEVFTSEERDKTLVVSMEEKVKQAQRNEALPYHIIGGCFGDVNNANKLVAKFSSRGSNPSIVGAVGSLHRVSVASFATKKEATEMLASYRNEIPNAWILYK